MVQFYWNMIGGPNEPSIAVWLHEIERDGYRIVARGNSAGVRLITRAGISW